MITRNENLSTDLKANSQRLGQEIKVAEENLKKELRNTSELLNITVNNLVKTNAELSNAKRDLTNILEETKQELEKTNIGLEKTNANVIVLSTKLNTTEKELTEIKIRAGNLSIEIKTNSLRLGHEIKQADDNLKKELRANLNRLETATTNLASTRTELSSTKSTISDLAKKINDRTREIVDIGRMPTSCLDLERMGHKLSGFFSVKGSKKIEMLYCDFYPNQNDKQKLIGYADVKSESVHFYVQRNSSFSTESTPIPFDLARVNEGNAMNLTSGKFKAPCAGIYFFSFTGLARYPVVSSASRFRFNLNLNGVLIGRGLVKDSSTVDDKLSPISFQSTLNLKKNDQVWIQINHCCNSSYYLFDDGNHNTHFTGFMLEEEIIASL
uniref:C1q domain-containing protein n=1 Tax=Daphnia galeata TaxID=27404 RepID=A0A8J2RSC7_9CRUS|nr:unnamed protein product [Daphnia galeata]